MPGNKNPLTLEESRGHNSETARCSCLRCAVRPAGRFSLSMSASGLLFFHQGAWFSVLCPSAAAWQRPSLLLLACMSAHPFNSPSQGNLGTGRHPQLQFKVLAPSLSASDVTCLSGLNSPVDQTPLERSLRPLETDAGRKTRCLLFKSTLLKEPQITLG